ncbi:unnamed protein product [Heterobilharzia americana]|nr:unnamed protein product [Heterobilharzia americana]
MNIFVAFFVLLLLLAESTPSAVKNFPLIGVFYCLNMIMITLSTFLATMVIHLYFRGDRKGPVPILLRRIVIEGIGRLTLVRQRVPLPDVRNSTRNMVTKYHRKVYTSKISPHKFSTCGQTRYQNERNRYFAGGFFPSCDDSGNHPVCGDHYLKNVAANWFGSNEYQTVNRHPGKFCPHVMGAMIKRDHQIPENMERGSFYENGFKYLPCETVNCDETEVISSTTTLESDVRELKKYVKIIVNRQKEVARKSLLAMEWRTLAIVLDRLFFFIYITTIVIAAVVSVPRNTEAEVPAEFRDSEE